MAGRSAILTIKILADAKQAAKGVDDASGKFGKFGGAVSRAAVPAAAGLAAIGAAAGHAAQAAAEDAQSQALLAQALKNSTGATSAGVAAAEDWISKTSASAAVADDELRPALATLARATGDVTASQTAMTNVLDIAAATGKDTQTVADALAKAYAGNTTSLGKLVPGLDRAVLKSGDMNKIMAELARVTGGSAAVAAETAAGKWQRAQVAFAEAKESIGAGLLPVLNTLTTRLAAFGTWAANNTQVVTTLAMVLGGLAAAVIAVNAVAKTVTALTRAWTAAQAVLNIVMTANPIGLIVVAIGALVAAIVIAYRNSETFRRIVQAAWSGIKDAALAAWNFIKRYVIDPFVAGVRWLYEQVRAYVNSVIVIWATLKAALKAVWDWVYANVIGPFVQGFERIVGAVKSVIDWIKKIKLPSAVTKLFGGGGKAAPGGAAFAPAPTVGGRGRAVPRSTRTVTAGSATTPPVTVNVFLDGQKVGGFIDRVIDRRLDAEGARLAAGAWR